MLPRAAILWGPARAAQRPPSGTGNSWDLEAAPTFSLLIRWESSANWFPLLHWALRGSCCFPRLPAFVINGRSYVRNPQTFLSTDPGLCMRSVVMISHYFPPEGSAGTYRPLRFVRHLPSHGWRPVVIAEKTQYYERYDPQLLDLLPSGVEIVRVPNPDPWKAIQERRTQKFRQKISSAPTDVIVRIATSHERPLRTTLRNLVHTIESIVYFPDLTMRWIRPATEAAIKACAQSGSEVIWATGGPWSSLVVARKVSRRTGLPYILDFRDSWTLEPDQFEARQTE